MKKLFSFLSFRVIGRKRTQRWLLKIFELLDFDMMQMAQHERGIDIYGDNNQTGENFFVKAYLKDKFRDSPVVMVDVGANVGNYSVFLAEIFPAATIYSFELNPAAFKKLMEKTTGLENIHCFPFGLGSSEKKVNLYTYHGEEESEHASVFKSVLSELHHGQDIKEYSTEIKDLDGFCEKNDIQTIHFLKIDTEGFELDVLKGAAGLIKRKRIDIIQFEFNSMNVYSRVYLHDFYQILPGYHFFRLSPGRLIPLNEYHPQNEVFLYQNIVALHL